MFSKSTETEVSNFQISMKMSTGLSHLYIKAVKSRQVSAYFFQNSEVGLYSFGKEVFEKTQDYASAVSSIHTRPPNSEQLPFK